MIKDETNFKALVSFHLLKLTVTKMENYDYFQQPLSLLRSTTISLQLHQITIKKACLNIQNVNYVKVVCQGNRDTNSKDLELKINYCTLLFLEC